MAALAACLLAAGCAGSKVNWDRARLLKPGMTETQIQDLLGKPYAVTARGGQQIWVWSHANGLSGATRSLALVVQDGKLVDAPHIPDSF
jgi:hypothetical protein